MVGVGPPDQASGPIPASRKVVDCAHGSSDCPPSLWSGHWKVEAPEWVRLQLVFSQMNTLLLSVTRLLERERPAPPAMALANEAAPSFELRAIVR